MSPADLTTEQKLDFKQQLKQTCINILQERIDTIAQAMQSAQESANSEEKSSAGDKYETGRAMSQLNREMYAAQLEEARTELALIESVNTTVLHGHITNGSVVMCRGFTFFIVAGLGNVTVNGQKIIMLSPQAPLALQLYKTKAGESFMFNQKTFEVLSAF